MHDIEEQATRHRRACSNKKYLLTDLELIEGLISKLDNAVQEKTEQLINDRESQTDIAKAYIAGYELFKSSLKQIAHNPHSAYEMGEIARIALSEA